MIYLDNSATTRQYGKVTESMVHAIEQHFANPSSLHRLGALAEKEVRNARKTIARSLGAKEEEILFTSGGTESDNMVLWGVAFARKRRGNKIIMSAIEHPAMLATGKALEDMGFCVEHIAVDGNGFIKMEALEKAIDDKTILVSIMHVNNEVGSIQPISEVKEMIAASEKRMGTEILFHTDGVQSFGKLPLGSCDAQLISVSGHKIHGPKGIGALYVQRGVTLVPHMTGGGQERNLRSGTENVPAIVGFAKAVEIACQDVTARSNAIQRIKEYLLSGIKEEIEDVRINSPDENACASILNVSFLGVRAEVLLHTLEQSEIYVSTGSACSSNKKGQSHVLKSMGLSDREIEGAIRFSFNEFNTIEEMEEVIARLKDGVNKFRRLGSFR